MTTSRIIRWAYWLLTVALFAGCLVMLRVYTPVEVTMGTIQKIFYLHLPVAINTFVAALVVCVASVGYLWQRSLAWDDLAAAAGKVTALFCGVVLLTGMIWGKKAWGAWWTWSPRLTFSLVLFLLYAVYLMIRPAIESPQRRAIVCAVYGIAAFLDVPMVYLSVKLMEDVHPSSIELAPEMKRTLLLWFVPVTLLMAGLVYDRYEVNRLLRAHQERSGAETPESAVTTSAGESA
jgi:heme exporter protein C